MCAVIKSRPDFKMGHIGSKTRSLGQFLEKPCVLSRRHSFDPVFMNLCQNDFLTLNKHLSRRAMLSEDSSCLKRVLNFQRQAVHEIRRSNRDNLGIIFQCSQKKKQPQKTHMLGLLIKTLSPRSKEMKIYSDDLGYNIKMIAMPFIVKAL